MRSKGLKKDGGKETDNDRIRTIQCIEQILQTYGKSNGVFITVVYPTFHVFNEIEELWQ